MPNNRTTLFATFVVASTGALWGLYWLPVRRLADLALPGAWGTLAILTAATLLLAPFAIRRRRQIARARPGALLSVGLGGAAFMFYSVGFVYGRVAIVILLFYLTPVWSTLIGRYVLRWKTPRLRIVAMAIGIIGLMVMLGADGDFPIPSGFGEWLGLVSGLLWSVATTGMRTRPDLEAPEAAFVFAAGAFLGALLLAPAIEPWPASVSFEDIGTILTWTVAAAGLWWALSMMSLLWATPRLEPARVGILLMTEVIVGTITGVALAREPIGLFEILGGLLVLSAGILEVWPVNRTVVTPRSADAPAQRR